MIILKWTLVPSGLWLQTEPLHETRSSPALALSPPANAGEFCCQSFLGLPQDGSQGSPTGLVGTSGHQPPPTTLLPCRVCPSPSDLAGVTRDSCSDRPGLLPPSPGAAPSCGPRPPLSLGSRKPLFPQVLAGPAFPWPLGTVVRCSNGGTPPAGDARTPFPSGERSLWRSPPAQAQGLPCRISKRPTHEGNQGKLPGPRLVAPCSDHAVCASTKGMTGAQAVGPVMAQNQQGAGTGPGPQAEFPHCPLAHRLV